MKRAACTLALTACLLSLALLVLPAFAAVSGEPGTNYVPGQVLVRMKAGCNPTALCAAMGLQLKKGFGILPDTYLLEGSQANVTALAATLSARPDVELVEPNYIGHLLATPNDVEFRNQWALKSMRIPEAWDLEKGRDGIIVAVIDTGASYSHPDLQRRLLQGKDFVNNTDDASDVEGHGTHVAGIIAASTDNGIGVSGVTWSGVRVLPLKVFPDAVNGAQVDWVISALEYAVTAGAEVVNMSISFGTQQIDILHTAIKEASDAGLVLVAAAGNSSNLRLNVSAPVEIPASYPEVIAVSAVGPDDKMATYSCVGPQICVAAPGGSGLVADDPAQEILSTYWDPTTMRDGYAAMQGTSMASPQVAGVCALLLSAGAKNTEIRSLLTNSARKTSYMKTTRDDFYGSGIVDANAALMQIALGVNLDRPLNSTTYTTYSTAPKIRGTVKYADQSTIQLFIDGNLVATSADPNPNAPLPKPNTTDVYRFVYQAKLGVGNHLVKLTAMNSRKIYRETTGRVLVRQYHIPSGLRLFSVPYALTAPDNTPESVFWSIGSDFRLARWINGTLPRYATYDPLTENIDDLASFLPSDLTTDEQKASAPRGLGYWVRVLRDAGVDVAVNGAIEDTTAYRIPLDAGWNLIGDPFDFAVDWSGVQVEYQGESIGVPAASAYPKNWIRPTIYRYDGQRYQWANSPDGQLLPWQAHWVKASVPCTLIVPPLPSSSGLALDANGSH